MTRTPAGSPPHPKGAERFHEERATYALRGSAQPDLEAGVAAIREVVRTLRPKPGVYRMLDARGDVLYVGKARSLKNRVANYCQVVALPGRLQRMVSQTRGLEIVTTNSEAEALLLEAQLIKRFRPPYNVLLRDDKSFPFILLRAGHDFPRIMKHRGRAQVQGRLLRPVRQRRIGQHHDQRAAEAVPAAQLHRQLLRPARPPVPAVPDQALRGAVRRADRQGGLRGADPRGEGLPRRQVGRGAEEDREADGGGRRGARFRKRGDAARPAARGDLHPGTQAINAEGVGNADVFALASKGGQVGIQAFFVAAGRTGATARSFPATRRRSPTTRCSPGCWRSSTREVPPPRTILVDRALPERELLEQALGEVAGHRIEISVPQRGDRRRLMEQASRNAGEALERRLAETGTQARTWRELTEFLELPEEPRRIEIYDNSTSRASTRSARWSSPGPKGSSRTSTASSTSRARSRTTTSA
jgi:excinuclease ABC subunit C